MLISEKLPIFQLLQQVGQTGSSGFLAFFRNGSSANVPRTFADLVATSRAAVDYKYVTQTTEANGLYTRLFTRGRSLMGFGGYGQGRTVYDPMSKQNIPTVSVYPEYTRPICAAGTNKTPAVIAAMAGAPTEITTGYSSSWSIGDVLECDYGRTLRMRSLFLGTDVLGGTAYFDMMYQDTTTLEWVRINNLVGGINDGLDITFRRLRLVSRSNRTEYLNFVPYVERGTEFVQSAITHVVLVPNNIAVPSGSAAYLSQIIDDYFGLVLDVGTDITIGVSATGKFDQMYVPDLVIRVADNFVEGV